MDDLFMDWSGEIGLVVRCPNSLYVIQCISWIMLWIVWWTYVGVLCALLVNDVASSALHYLLLWSWRSWKFLEVLWWFMHLIMWCMIISTNMLIILKNMVLLFPLNDHVRLWLCPCMCSPRVDGWFFLLDYVSLMMVILMTL